ncbi:MAG TPA: DNA recombination protein RmuC [Actinomycetaceae bacterium]|nr:DNA recombination protein RmuC [Actinomycetaceae bacterium]
MAASDVLFLLLGLLAGGLGGYAIAHSLAARRSAALQAEAAAAKATADGLAAQHAELQRRASADADVLRALAPVTSSLDHLQQRIATLERERTEQFSALRQQLTDARHGETELRQATAQLASALRAGPTRGQWGELQLRRILEASGMLRHVDFVEQRTVADASRPDVIVHLPGEHHLVIDAKVPLDAFLEATALDPYGSPEEAAERQRLLAAHAKALRGHVMDLAGRRYHEALPTSPELVVLFVPSEALLAAALDADASLLEDALRVGVAPASPSSLLALLRTAASIWSAATVAEEANELLELGRELYSRLASLSTHVRKVGRGLESTVAHYNAMVGSLETRLLVTARRFEGFATDELEASPISGDKAQLRPFTAPELVAQEE